MGAQKGHEGQGVLDKDPSCGGHLCRSRSERRGEVGSHAQLSWHLWAWQGRGRPWPWPSPGLASWGCCRKTLPAHGARKPPCPPGADAGLSQVTGSLWGEARAPCCPEAGTPQSSWVPLTPTSAPARTATLTASVRGEQVVPAPETWPASPGLAPTGSGPWWALGVQCRGGGTLWLWEWAN